VRASAECKVTYSAARICFTYLIHHCEQIYAGARNRTVRLYSRLFPIFHPATLSISSRPQDTGPKTRHEPNRCESPGISKHRSHFRPWGLHSSKKDPIHELPRPVVTGDGDKDRVSPHYLEDKWERASAGRAACRLQRRVQQKVNPGQSRNLSPSNGDCEHWPPIRPLSEPLACPTFLADNATRLRNMHRRCNR